MNAQTSKKGFTIIEVVLVLAIAALIFLMIFIALPALQRGQRDTARKSDVGTVVTNVTGHTSNNRGALPTTAAQINSGVSSNMTVSAPATGAANGNVTAVEDRIDVYRGVKCGTVGANGSVTFAASASGTRSFSVVTRLEGNNASGFCQDNG